MGITYGIIQETHEADVSKRKSYGIAAYSDVEVNGTGCILYSACDLSDEKETLELLVERLNREQISEEHFAEIIEDYLAMI